MAWKLDGKDIVIDGFNEGIADSAELGLADLRNVNIISEPTEASVNFATIAVTIPPTYTAANGTFNSATDTVTYTPGVVAIYNGTSMTFSASSGGVTINVVYWAGNVTATTFKLYTAPNSTDPGLLVDLSDNSVHVFSTITLGAGTQYALDFINSYNFFQDANGRVWWYAVAGGGNGARLIHIGPLATGSGLELLGHGNGLVVWGGPSSSQAQYLFAFRDSAVEVFSINGLVSTDPGATSWVQNDFASGIVATTTGSHQAIASSNGGLYFCNTCFVGSILPTTSTFDPVTSSTYIATGTALAIPTYDKSTWLGELGSNLLVGGILNYIYPWDKLSKYFQNPIILAEYNTQKIVSTNANAYLFTGNRGRIYVTNGSNVDLFKKFPDQIANLVEPYWTWGGAMYWRNQTYFGIQSTTNAGGSFDTSSGAWVIDLTSKALRGSNTFSYGNYQTGSMPVVAPNISTSTPGGGGIFAMWTNGSSFGLDISSTSPYTSIDLGTRIISDLIPIGTYFKPKTFNQVQFKLSKTMVAGEEVRLSYRTSLSSLFVEIGHTTTAGVMSDAYPINFEKVQWIQILAETSSTASSPSYTRLTELRITKDE